MKAQTKAIVASLVVIALALSAVSGVTYSWWSDTEQTEIDVTTGAINLSVTPDVGYKSWDVQDYDFSDNNGVGFTSDNQGYVSYTQVSVEDMIPGDSFQVKYDLSLDNTIPVKFNVAVASPGEPFVVVDAFSINGMQNDNTIAPGEHAGNGTVTVTLPVNAGNQYQGQSYHFGIVIGAYQYNMPESELPQDSVTTVQSIPASGATVTAGNASIEFGDGSTLNNTVATVEALNSVAPGDVSYSIQDNGTVLGGVDVSFNQGGGLAPGETATVTMIFDGTYPNIAVYHEGVEVQNVSVTANSPSAGKTTVSFQASEFSAYYAVDTTEAAIGDVKYATLAGAIDAVTVNADEAVTIDLLRNVSDGAGISVPSGKNFILDLNGYTYTFNHSPTGSSGTQSQGFQLLKDSTITIRNGTLDAFYDEAAGYESAFALLIQNYCNLTLEDVVLDGTNLDRVNHPTYPAPGTPSVTVSNNCGEIHFTESTVIIANDSGISYAFDVYDYTVYNYDLPTVTVEDSVVIGGPIKAAAMIDNDDSVTYYATFQQALGAAESGDSIDLFDDVSISNPEFTKPVTINGNGHEMAITGQQIGLASGTVFNDVVFVATTTNNLFEIAGDVDVTFDGCEFNANCSTPGGLNFIQANAYAGKLVVKDSTFDQDGDNVNRSIRVVALSGADVTVTGCEFTGGQPLGNDSDYLTPVKVSGSWNALDLSGNTIDLMDAYILIDEEGVNYVTRTVDGAVGNLDGVYYKNVKDAIVAGVPEIVLGAGKYYIDLYNIEHRDSLTITGQGANTKIEFANLQVRASQFGALTIEDCTIERMPNKSWGHLVFGSSTVEGGVYTISNCIFNGVGSQGIYINQTVAATFNIENCIFNGDFGDEGAITIQKNNVGEPIVNVEGCEFNGIPETSNDIFIIFQDIVNADYSWRPVVDDEDVKIESIIRFSTS